MRKIDGLLRSSTKCRYRLLVVAGLCLLYTILVADGEAAEPQPALSSWPSGSTPNQRWTPQLAPRTQPARTNNSYIQESRPPTTYQRKQTKG